MTVVVNWGEWREVAVVAPKIALRTLYGDGFITGFRLFSENRMASFREIRNLFLESFDDDDISEDEFLLLYDVNTSKNPDSHTTAMERST